MSSPTDNWVSRPNESRGPLISVSLWSLTAVSLTFLSLRLFVRFNSAKLWIDDLLLCVSWACLAAEVSMNQMAINLGFGKHALNIDLQNLEGIAIYGASGLTLSTCAINISKISFAVTLLRLATTTRWAKLFLWFAIGTLVIFAVPAAIMPWVQCKPLVKTFVDIFPGECIDKRPTIKFGEFCAYWAAIMDFSLAMIPWAILWNVQMRNREKIGIGFAMSLGILAGTASIIRGRYLRQLIALDVSWDAANSVIWTGAETAITIIATSIPVLRVFLRDKVTSAVGYINNSSGRSRNHDSEPKSPNWSRNISNSIQSTTTLSKKDRRNTKDWIILNDVSDLATRNSDGTHTHQSQGSLDESRQVHAH